MHISRFYIKNNENVSFVSCTLKFRRSIEDYLFEIVGKHHGENIKEYRTFYVKHFLMRHWGGKTENGIKNWNDFVFKIVTLGLLIIRKIWKYLFAQQLFVFRLYDFFWFSSTSCEITDPR